MGYFEVLSDQFENKKINGHVKKIISHDKYEMFTTDILGLGKIDGKSREVESIAVVFDLKGFTDFSRQIDPQLVVPAFLEKFLSWIFCKIRDIAVKKEFEEGYELWTGFPFFVKFMGDGLLMLWDCTEFSDVEVCNIIGLMNHITEDYSESFLNTIVEDIHDAPQILRCGIARGKVFSVGEMKDFVGPCINLAARLQKLSMLTFAFSRRGFDYKNNMNKKYASEFVVKKTEIRGIGNELVVVFKKEFESLPDSEKKLFSDI